MSGAPNRLVFILRRNPWWSLLFVVGACLTLGFAVKIMREPPPWERAGTIQPIAGWMTPRFVAHNFNVPRDALGDALGLPRGDETARMTIAEIAASQNRSEAALIAAIEALRPEGGVPVGSGAPQ